MSALTPATVRGESGSDAVNATGRVLDVLAACVDSSGPIGVTELANRLGLSKAVVFRILRVMLSRGLLTYIDASKHYALGPLAFQMGARMLAGSDIRAAALPIMRELRDASGESVSLGVLTHDHNTYIDQVPSVHEVRLMVELGRPFPLHAGAQGKVTLAFAAPQLRERVLDGELQALTDLTVVDRGALRREIAAIRLAGSAVSLGERVAGAAAVAAPILNSDGYAEASIAICGPRHRFDEAAVARYRLMVIEGAARITQRCSAG